MKKIVTDSLKKSLIIAISCNTTYCSPDSVLFSEEDSGEGTDEDIEVEAEIEEKDPIVSRRDEMSGLTLLAARFITTPVPVPVWILNADERPIKPKIG